MGMFDNEIYIVPDSLRGKIKAVVYTRVSTKQQVKGSGLQRQREGCLAFAERAALEIVAIHEDAGLSGDLYQARPALQAALEDLENGRAEVLLVESMDRLTRNTEHSHLIWDRVRAAGAVLIMREVQRVGSPDYELAQNLSALLRQYKQDVLEGRA